MRRRQDDEMPGGATLRSSVPLTKSGLEMNVPPLHTYYGPKHGRWRGEYRFTIQSLRALFVGSMGLFDKLAFAVLGVLCRVLGPLRIETTVDASSLEQGWLDHTTRITKWGIPLQSSRERFEFGADGRTLVVIGKVRSLPFIWGRPFHHSSGEVDDLGERASYRFAWGCPSG